MQILRDLVTEDDRAAVVVSHDARLEASADRVLRLEDGRLPTATGVTAPGGAVSSRS